MAKAIFIEADMDPYSIETQRIVAAYERRKSIVPPSRYSVFNPENTLGSQELEREILALLDQENFDPPGEKLILEIGCGTGGWLREFVKWGALPDHLVGIDLLPERIEKARKLCLQGVRLECGNAARLVFPNDFFDVVFQSTVFTSILDRGLRHAVAAEMLRVLNPNGFIIWYDFHWNNPRNSDVRGIRGQELRELFPACQVRMHRVILCSHYLALIRRN